ncbi:MAG: relaxase/mobilization nuclease domain-containing protein [Eubacterium sp.]|nr:relaxase/mobilization nuclease domain-containing protein [Eubacterium sp.]
MAINKVVNKSTKSHGAMRNVLEYVLRDEKIKEGYVFIAGPYSGETVNYDELYQTWLKEKYIWDKDSGRMYAHNIISFHKDEEISPEEVLKICKQFAEHFFPEHQYVIGVHQDKDHLHGHIVTNSVSYIDGHKLHQTKKDLQKQKDYTNRLCLEYGLSVAEKGKHFDGSLIEQGEIMAWNQDKYNLLINESKNSFVAVCAIALMESIPQSASREEFISEMQQRGWSVIWKDNRKHIVFKDENGNKVRDTNIEKTFTGLNVSKEALIHEFKKQNEVRLADQRADKEREAARKLRAAEYERYYAEVESAGIGIDNAKAVRENTATERRNSETVRRDSEAIIRESEAVRNYSESKPDPEESPDSNRPSSIRTGATSNERQRDGYQNDTESFIRELNSQEGASEEKRNDSIVERANREAERCRLSIERERAAERERQAARERIERDKKKVRSRGFSR